MSEHKKEQTAAEMLFEARTAGRRKREINTISKLLCIREEYLVALEKGKYEVIPEVVYILGFARNYAMELGLDPDEIVGKIKKELGLVAECDTDPSVDDKLEVEPKTAALNAPKKKSAKSDAFSALSKYIYKYWKWIVAGILALAVIIGLVIFIANIAGGESTVPDTSAPVVAIVKEPEYKVTVREKFGTENRATAHVVIQATAETWVKIEDARGNTVFSRVLVAGDVYYVPDGDKYKGTFGNAAGLDVWVDGNLAPKLGAAHTRKTGVLMTAEALMPGAAPVVPAASSEYGTAE